MNYTFVCIDTTAAFIQFHKTYRFLELADFLLLELNIIEGLEANVRTTLGPGRVQAPQLPLDLV